MKKLLKSVLLLILTLVCMLSFSLVVFSEQRPTASEETTKTVLESVLQERSMAEYPKYREYRTACERFCRESEAFSELMQRPDAMDVLKEAEASSDYSEQALLGFLKQCIFYRNSGKQDSKLLAICSASAGGSDEQPYAYPVVPGTSAWKRLKNMSEMMKACQIPEEKAANMTTDALLASVLDYPLLASCFTYDHPEDYCDLLMQNFNGLKELFSRKDVLECLEEKRTAQNGDFIAEGNLRFIFDCYDYLSVRG